VHVQELFFFYRNSMQFNRNYHSPVVSSHTQHSIVAVYHHPQSLPNCCSANGHVINAPGIFINGVQEQTLTICYSGARMLRLPLNAAAVRASGLHLVLADHQPPVAPAPGR
jgi:hypothetical protein